MKTLLLAFSLFMLSAPSLYDFPVLNIEGKKMDLTKYKGKKILIVNTASECGFTGQFKGLQELADTYKGKLVVIGFPANNFGGQEPGSNEEILAYCSKKYNVTFPMAGKISVKGDDIDPLFKWLTSAENPDFTGPVKWNFEKFLIDEKGKLIRRFRSTTKPMGDDITSAIEGKSEKKK